MDWSIIELLAYFGHVFVGGFVYLAGAFALSIKKGGFWHTQLGKFYVFAMVVPILTTFVFLMETFLPLGLVLALASSYFTASGFLAFKASQSYAKTWHLILMFVLLLLLLATTARTIQAFSLEPNLIHAPLLMALVFGFCFIQDIQALRKWPDNRKFWVARHLQRMVLSFGFLTMAIVRIGIKMDIGLSLEITVTFPLLLAIALAFYFHKKYA